MKVIRTLNADQPGAQKYRASYGDNLIAVRYRRDQERRYITVELIVEERQAPAGHASRVVAQDKIVAHLPVAIRVLFEDNVTRQLVKRHKAKWSQQQKLWYLPRGLVHALNLTHLIVEGAFERCIDVDFGLEEPNRPIHRQNYPYKKRGL